MENYDAVIIGGGIGGLMLAYRLMEKDPSMKVMILEKGRKLEERQCPIVAGKTERCVKCVPCAIMEGMAGAGAFSDGKYNITTEYGGWLPDFMDHRKVLDYIEQADQVLQKFGADNERYMPDNELKTLCLQHDLHMQQAEVKHLGTDANYGTMLNLIHDLETRVTIKTLAEVTDVNRETHCVTYVSQGSEKQVTGEKIHLFSRIISVADIYDALVTERPYKKPFSPRAAVEMIMSMTEELDIKVMKCFMESVILYPVGSDVMLSTGEMARVVENLPYAVLRPKVLGMQSGKVYDLANDVKCANIIIL